MRVLGVDPGDKHVGVASVTDGKYDWALERTPEEFIEMLLHNEPPDVLAMESFSLDPRRAKYQAGSRMATAALIGAVKALAQYRGYRVVMQQPSCRGVVEKSPFWKNVTEGISYESDHARDALCHAVYCYYFDLTNDRFQREKK